MSFNYRFSVIPAGAITDARLTPRALQVLCLLGRHTNDNGWCSRSQVKMAKELGCSRGAIQAGLELLYEAGWVEKRANGRGRTGPETSEYPFAAHSYRVILDREVAAEATPKRAQEVTPEGASQMAGGATMPAGGATMLAPLEGDYSNRISSEEPERESARAHERKATGLATFEQRWPTAAADDRNKTAYAWEELSVEERDTALDSIGAFLEDLKRHKRSAVPAGWKYLEQRRWLLLAKNKPKDQAEGVQRVATDSREGRALATLCRIGRALLTDFGTGCYLLNQPMSPQGLAFAEAPPESEWLLIPPENYKHVRAWNDFLGRELAGKNRGELVSNRNPGGYQGFMAPWPWPPRKDGTITAGADPPKSQDEDLDYFAEHG